jgi:hypothetical protein
LYREEKYGEKFVLGFVDPLELFDPDTEKKKGENEIEHHVKSRDVQQELRPGTFNEVLVKIPEFGNPSYPADVVASILVEDPFERFFIF